MVYAELFLCRSHLPSLIELAIHKNILLTIIIQDQQQARNDRSKVANLQTSENSFLLSDTIFSI